MLIEALITFRQRRGHDITVVFDGWKTGEGQESQSVTGGIRVIYSRIGEKADILIKRIVSTVKRQWIVVSSDRDIANHAWSVGSIPVAVEDFFGILGRKELSFDADEQDDNEDILYRRKGNPRQLSKKEKALARALSKL
jgi:hypothetical protein